MQTGFLLLGAITLALRLTAQANDPIAASVRLADPPVPALSDERIFGVIPGYQFVEKPDLKLPPLT